MFTLLQTFFTKIAIFATGVIVAITAPFHAPKPVVISTPTPIVYSFPSVTITSSPSPQPTVIQPQPQVTTANTQPLIDCTGPDKKIIKLTQKACDDFNLSWGNTLKRNPSPNINNPTEQVQLLQQSQRNSFPSTSVQTTNAITPTPTSSPTSRPTPTPITWPTWTGSCKGAPFSFSINFSSKESVAPDGTLLDRGSDGRLQYFHDGTNMSVEIDNPAGGIVMKGQLEGDGTIILGNSGTYTIKVLSGDCGFYQLKDLYN